MAGIPLILYRTNNTICPVMNLLAYLNTRTLGARDTLAPLFVTPQGQALSRQYFLQHLRVLLQIAGYNPDLYNGHSFRIGAATTAAQAGVPDHLIKTLGRWKSDCYVRYIRTSLTNIHKAQQQMAGFQGQ